MMICKASARNKTDVVLAETPRNRSNTTIKFCFDSQFKLYTKEISFNCRIYIINPGRLSDAIKQHQQQQRHWPLAA